MPTNILTVEGTMIPAEYSIPWSVYKKYFPEGNINEFDRAFVTFDLTKEDLDEMENAEDYLLLEGVVFDMTKITTQR